MIFDMVAYSSRRKLMLPKQCASDVNDEEGIGGCDRVEDHSLHYSNSRSSNKYIMGGVSTSSDMNLMISMPRTTLFSLREVIMSTASSPTPDLA